MDALKEKFTALYDQNIEAIYRFVYLKVSSQDIAEDLTAEVFMRFWKKLTQAEIENPRAFLYQVARNVVADHYRSRNSRLVDLAETEELVETPRLSLEEIVDIGVQMEHVQKALAVLHDDYQNYIIWRYLEELSVPEIMEITGKREENVRVGIYRALQALRKCLELEKAASSSATVMKRGATPTYL